MVFGIFIQSLLGVPNTYFKNAVKPMYTVYWCLLYGHGSPHYSLPQYKVSHKFHPLTKNQKQNRPFSMALPWRFVDKKNHWESPLGIPKSEFLDGHCVLPVYRNNIDIYRLHNPWTILNLPFTGPFNDVFPKDGLNGQLRDFGPCIFISAWSNSLCLRRFGIPKLTLQGRHWRKVCERFPLGSLTWDHISVIQQPSHTVYGEVALRIRAPTGYTTSKKLISPRCVSTFYCNYTIIAVHMHTFMKCYLLIFIIIYIWLYIYMIIYIYICICVYIACSASNGFKIFKW